MVKSLFVISDGIGRGKTLLSLGIALRFKNEGYKVGFFKPVATEMRIEDGVPMDEDVELMKDVLCLDSSTEDLAPLVIGYDFLEELSTQSKKDVEDKLDRAFKKVADDVDILVMEGAQTPDTLSFMGLSSITLAKKFKSRLIIVSRGESDHVVDNVVNQKHMADCIGCNLMGCVLNNVPQRLIARTNRYIVPPLKENGIDVLGIIPEDITLVSPTVAEVCDVMGGEVLEGKDHLDRLIVGSYIGAASIGGAQQYYHDMQNKALITGGDRADMAIAGIEAGISLLILTANLYPSQGVLTMARKKGVPVLLVPYDTFTTVKRLDVVTGRVKSWDKKKIELCEQKISEFIDWKGMLDRL
ncbi:MAG: AAA family ATPase [Halobacteriota archaeon]|nr:AAA family ATPase [Halobacteriota archaeon]